jgi:hypothetical protein
MSGTCRPDSRFRALLSGEIRDGIVAVESTAVLLGLNPREARAFSDFSVGSAGAGERRGQSGTRLRHSGVGPLLSGENSVMTNLVANA